MGQSPSVSKSSSAMPKKPSVAPPPTETTAHNCSEHYKKIRKSKKHFKCYACKMTGRGRRYQCDLCERKLHIECRNPPISTTNEFYQRSNFEFRENDSVEFSRYCDVCGHDIRGISYHCKASERDLHPQCADLQMTVDIGDRVFKLKPKPSSKCLWCEKRKFSNDKSGFPGLSYVSSTCNKCHYHVYCLFKMVDEAKAAKALEKAELQKLDKSRGKKKGGKKIFFPTIKILLRVVGVLLGDPISLISTVLGS